MEQSEHTPFSHHIFLFPFKWDILSKDSSFAEETINKRCDLGAFTRLLENSPFLLRGDKGKPINDEIQLRWKSCHYNFGSVEKTPYNYSEYTYFYDFVQHALYDVREQENEPVRYFELEAIAQCNNNSSGQVPPYKDTYLSVTRLKKAKEKNGNSLELETFRLKLTSINLHTFNTGVGVLSFFTENHEHSDPASILLINQLVRRIYPEFLETKPGREKDMLLETQLATMLAKEIKFQFGQQEVTFDYTEYNNPNELWKQTYRLPRRIQQFFPSTISDDSEITFLTKASSDSVLIRNVMDDRMFTLCWYGNNHLSGFLRRPNRIAGGYRYETDPFWFTFVAADNPGSPTVQNHKLLRQYIDRFTYGRWANYGTLYGVTRETFVILSEEIEKLTALHAPPIHQHIQQMYYQMVILCLVQRASVLRFTAEITPLAQKIIRRDPSQNPNDKDSTATLANQVSNLYGHYIDFLNRLYLREITAQIQGDELYTQLQNQMELKADVDNLGKQLNELNTYVEGMQRKVAEKQRAEEERLTKELNTTIGWLAPLSIIGGLFSFIGIDKLMNWERKIDPYFFLATNLYVIATLIFLIYSPTILRYIKKIIRPDIKSK